MLIIVIDWWNITLNAKVINHQLHNQRLTKCQIWKQIAHQGGFEPLSQNQYLN